MRYMLKSGKHVLHHATGRVIAVLPTVEAVEAGHDSVGVMIDMTAASGLQIKLAVQPTDFDDEASHVQLVRLAERLQLMATAASNRRARTNGGVP